MKKETTAKVILLTIATFGLYGAYWAMSQMFTPPDVDDDEAEKGKDFVDRAATSALLMRHDLH